MYLTVRALIAPEAIGQGFEVPLDIELTHFDKHSVESFAETLAGFDEVHVKAKLSGSVEGAILSGTIKVGIVKTTLSGSRA